jgi:hypothetical protein
VYKRFSDLFTTGLQRFPQDSAIGSAGGSIAKGVTEYAVTTGKDVFLQAFSP